MVTAKRNGFPGRPPSALAGMSIVLLLSALSLHACGLDVAGVRAGQSNPGASSSSSGLGGAGGAGLGGDSAGGMGGSGGVPVLCGNGAVEAGEECDDGNAIDQDGCSAACVRETSDNCPGTAILLDPGTKVLNGNTIVATNIYLPSDCGQDIGKGNDYVYAVTPSAGGTLRVELAASFAGVLYARRQCAGPYFNNQLACAHTGNESEISLWVYPGVTYYVFVDGETNTEDGPYSLQLTLMPCGNAQVEGLEQCDDPADPTCVGCLTCKGKDELFASPDGQFEHSPWKHCYLNDTKNSLNWLDARRACLAWGGDLASVSSYLEGIYLNGFIDADTWIGANDMASEDQFEWSSGEPLRFTNWNTFEPNNFAEEDCVFMNGDTRWIDDDCSTSSHPYLCERVPQGTCGDGFVSGIEECDDGNMIANDGCTKCVVDCAPNEFKHPISHHCYRIESVAKKSWGNAVADCALWGGRLATIESKYENVFLGDKVTEYTWMGASDQSVEGQFVWVTGEPVLHTAWNFGEPNNANWSEDCAEIGPGGGWNDAPCDLVIPYVCERVPAGIQ